MCFYKIKNLEYNYEKKMKILSAIVKFTQKNKIIVNTIDPSIMNIVSF